MSVAISCICAWLVLYGLSSSISFVWTAAWDEGPTVTTRDHTREKTKRKRHVASEMLRPAALHDGSCNGWIAEP